MADKTEVQKVEIQKIETRKEASKEPKKEVEKTGIFSNILAVAGLVILLAIIFWGLFNLGVLSKQWFRGLFSASSKSIQVTVPKTKLPSGEAFSISWRYTPRSAGTYALLYQCREGFRFTTTSVAGVQNEIPCGTGYTMLSKDNVFKVTPVLSGTSSLAVPFSVIFMPSATSSAGRPTSQAQGNATVTVINPDFTATPAEVPAPKPAVAETPARPQVPIPTQSARPAEVIPAPVKQVFGLPDLSVRILSKGVIDPISGDIIPREPVSADEIVAVRFLISNVGGSTTGPWFFTAQLPTSPAYPYTSPAQVPLARGSSIENMLRFKNAVPGGLFSVSVDPVNEVKESSEINNAASVTI